MIAKRNDKKITAGGAILARLKAVGVDYIFANSGTDFPPIIEGLAEAAARPTALVREACKWDYELRFPEQALEIVDRAHAIASTTPKGPVYLSLPREVLCETCPAEALDRASIMQPVISAPPAHVVQQAARMLAGAKNPVIIAQRGAGSANGFATLGKLASDWGIPVVQYWAI